MGALHLLREPDARRSNPVQLEMDTYHLHIRCFAVWELERMKP